MLDEQQVNETGDGEWDIYIKINNNNDVDYSNKCFKKKILRL